MNQHEVRRYDQLFSYLPEGALLAGRVPADLRLPMEEADARSFAPCRCLACVDESCTAS